MLLRSDHIYNYSMLVLHWKAKKKWSPSDWQVDYEDYLIKAKLSLMVLCWKKLHIKICLIWYLWLCRWIYMNKTIDRGVWSGLTMLQRTNMSSETLAGTWGQLVVGLINLMWVVGLRVREHQLHHAIFVLSASTACRDGVQWEH